MNRELLKRRAFELEAMLRKYEPTHPDAVKYHSAIADLLAHAKEGTLMTPISLGNFPGEWFFTEGSLGTLSDLSDASAKFSIEASGGPDPALQKFRIRNGLDPLTGDREASHERTKQN
jgi:hypothetical protein